MTNKRFAIYLSLALCGLLATSFAAAQQDKLQLDHLNWLASRATESIEVSLDQTALRALTRLAPLTGREHEKLSALSSRLKGVYVRGYEFEREGEFTTDDIEAIRSQLRAPGWTRVVQVGGRNGSNEEVFLKQGNDDIDAYAVVSSAPQKICVINVIGPLKLDDIGLLDREYGISNCSKRSKRLKSK
jgi:hypothetical protein